MRPSCLSCKHHYLDEFAVHARCEHPDVLHGDEQYLAGGSPPFAKHIRREDSLCGLDAKLFVPLPPKPAAKWWEFWK